MAWQVPIPELPRSPPMLLMLTIEPELWCVIRRTSSHRHGQVAFTFTAGIRSKSTSRTVSSRPPGGLDLGSATVAPAKQLKDLPLSALQSLESCVDLGVQRIDLGV